MHKVVHSSLISEILDRKQSFFQSDITEKQSELTEILKNSRLLIIGAAGSIGSSFVKIVAEYKPSALYLIDPSENNLVELVRDIRSSRIVVPNEFASFSIGFGTNEFEFFLKAQKPFDYIINFAAMKHVRSERDPYSMLRMFNVNVSANWDLIKSLSGMNVKKIFSVSSDKAVNPASFMGATKAFMERIFLTFNNMIPFSSARFANVAFSDGSLLHGFRYRIEKKQPLSAPNDVRRYFISGEEAGQLCLLSCFLGNNKEIYFPKMNPKDYLITFSSIALTFLTESGLNPIMCDSEEEARERALLMTDDTNDWPCYFSASNTSGEKMFEEFYSENEEVDLNRCQSAGVITAPIEAEKESIEVAIRNFKEIEQSHQWSKIALIDLVKSVVPEFQHVSSSINLDQKM